jgi:hypothetical protein
LIERFASLRDDFLGRFARVGIWLDGGLLLKALDYSTRQVKAGL